MAINRNRIQIEIDADSRGATEGVRRAQTSFQRFGRFISDRFVVTLGDASRAIGSLVRSFTDTIAAANAQEDAIKKLDAALEPLGPNADAASEALQKQAAALQQVTTAGDEAIITQQALLANLGVQVEQIPQATQAALDLSAALGISLESATRNVGRTVGGFAGELGELIPELKELDQEALKAGAGIELLAEKFAGRAQADATTFSGLLKQLGNDFGDLQEDVGEAITQNEGFRASLESLRNIVKRFGPEIAQVAATSLAAFAKAAELAAKAVIRLGDATSFIINLFEDYTGQVDAVLVREEALALSAEKQKKTREQLRAELGLAKDAQVALLEAAQEEVETVGDTEKALRSLLGTRKQAKESTEEQTETIEEQKQAVDDVVAADADWVEAIDTLTRRQERLRTQTDRATQSIVRQAQVAASVPTLQQGISGFGAAGTTSFNFQAGKFVFIDGRRVRVDAAGNIIG